jgi:hypothetical protein
MGSPGNWITTNPNPLMMFRTNPVQNDDHRILCWVTHIHDLLHRARVQLVAGHCQHKDFLLNLVAVHGIHLEMGMSVSKWVLNLLAPSSTHPIKVDIVIGAQHGHHGWVHQLGCIDDAIFEN